jgi:hypothetical protein
MLIVINALNTVEIPCSSVRHATIGMRPLPRIAGAAIATRLLPRDSFPTLTTPLVTAIGCQFLNSRTKISITGMVATP